MISELGPALSAGSIIDIFQILYHLFPLPESFKGRHQFSRSPQGNLMLGLWVREGTKMRAVDLEFSADEVIDFDHLERVKETLNNMLETGEMETFLKGNEPKII